LNPRPPGPQPDALPTELHSPPSISFVGPSVPPQAKSQTRLARQKGFEPLTHGLEGRCSFHLSYWRESGRADLNGRPPAPKAGALPGCATPRAISINTRQSPSQPRVPDGDAAGHVRARYFARFADTACDPKSQKAPRQHRDPIPTRDAVEYRLETASRRALRDSRAFALRVRALILPALKVKACCSGIRT
jgi:hypothetical protein